MTKEQILNYLANVKSEYQKEMSNALGVKVDLADSTGMGRTAKKFIIDRAIYV